MLGAFFKQINALHLNTHERLHKQAQHAISSLLIKSQAYFVLQGFPTTITLTLRDATAFNALPCCTKGIMSV